MHLDFKLTLRRDTVETAAACITLNSYDAQTVAGILADAFERCKSVIIDKRFESLSLFTDSFLLLTCFIYDLVELFLFLFEDMFIIGKLLFVVFDLLKLGLLFCLGFAYMLFSKFYFKSFKLFLFLKESELTVIPHVIDLLFTEKTRLGMAEKFFDRAGKRINIDHHVSNESGCGDVNYVVTDASSTSELIYQVIEDKKDIDVEIAKALYIGMIHDTGVFQYSNTSPRTLKIASELIAYGFNFTELIDRTFYEKTYIQNQILGRALLESILFMNGRCVVSMIDKKTMAFYNAQPHDLDGIVSQLRKTKGVECAVFMYQTDNMEYKVSLRSGELVDVAQVAAFFGGGGHVRAAGVTMQGTFYDIINNLSAQIEKQLK